MTADRIVALSGNPNVGKSTVFNALTGLRQHTGNWPGKTVTNARGYCQYGDVRYALVDLPGCYSLIAHSAEEEVARDFICFQHPDAVIVVCDATCLERNLNLVLQTLEITRRVIVCVNLMDEAKKKNIAIDLAALSQSLGVPVIPTAARGKEGLQELMRCVHDTLSSPVPEELIRIPYPDYIEDSLCKLTPLVERQCGRLVNARWLSLKMLERDEAMVDAAGKCLGVPFWESGEIAKILLQFQTDSAAIGKDDQKVKDDIVSALVTRSETICRQVVSYPSRPYDAMDRKADRVLTSRLTGYPLMIVLLLGILWLTVTGANYPSQLLSSVLFGLEEPLFNLLIWCNLPLFFAEMLVRGVYRVLAWVVSVMLPPMAIFFPLFTLLEDVGYLPRVAFNLDKCCQKCHACGKQALTMWMGNLCCPACHSFGVWIQWVDAIPQ